MVDTKKIQVPHPISLNAGLVESEFHPNPTDRRVRPFLTTDKNIKFVWTEPVTFPVFIPTIPEYLDSCLSCTGGQSHMDDESYAVPEWDLDYLSRYLALDLPHQQAKLFPKVHQANLLEDYFINRQRRQEVRIEFRYPEISLPWTYCWSGLPPFGALASPSAGSRRASGLQATLRMTDPHRSSMPSLSSPHLAPYPIQNCTVGIPQPQSSSHCVELLPPATNRGFVPISSIFRKTID